MMQVNKITRLSVGDDLSRTSPIYRPSVHGPPSELFCENSSLRPTAPQYLNSIGQAAGDKFLMKPTSSSSLGKRKMYNATRHAGAPPPSGTHRDTDTGDCRVS